MVKTSSNTEVEPRRRHKRRSNKGVDRSYYTDPTSRMLAAFGNLKPTYPVTISELFKKYRKEVIDSEIINGKETGTSYFLFHRDDDNHHRSHKRRHKRRSNKGSSASPSKRKPKPTKGTGDKKKGKKAITSKAARGRSTKREGVVTRGASLDSSPEVAVAQKKN